MHIQTVLLATELINKPNGFLDAQMIPIGGVSPTKEYPISVSIPIMIFVSRLTNQSEQSFTLTVILLDKDGDRIEGSNPLMIHDKFPKGFYFIHIKNQINFTVHKQGIYKLKTTIFSEGEKDEFIYFMTSFKE